MIRTHRAFRAAAAAAAALVLWAVPGSADTEMGDNGRVGPHHLRDTVAAPGATCTYADVDGHMVLQSITVRPPVMRARDRSDLRDRQHVSWRVQLMAWVPVPDEPWMSDLKQVGSGPMVRGTAWDDTRAALEAQTIDVPPSYHPFEIRIRMAWYKPGSWTKEVGITRHMVDLYRVEGDDAPWGSCQGTIL